MRPNSGRPGTFNFMSILLKRETESPSVDGAIVLDHIDNIATWRCRVADADVTIASCSAKNCVRIATTCCFTGGGSYRHTEQQFELRSVLESAPYRRFAPMQLHDRPDNSESQAR